MGGIVSFDLVFWHAESVPSRESALAIYDRLTEGEVGVVQEADEIGRFFEEVVSRFPDLTERNVESSPWASPIYRTAECVIVAISGSRSSDIGPILHGLASRHGLITFDPQSGEVVV
jgi:hypothetical protein